MRVMTYNIRHGQGNEPFDGSVASAGGVIDLERTAAVIRSQDPDIVAIQEVDRFWPRSGSIDQPSELARILGMEARFGPNVILSPGESGKPSSEYGVLILSKLPVFSSVHEHFPHVESYEARGFIEVRIEIEGVGPIAAICTHLEVGNTSDPAESSRQRAEQAEILASRVTSSGFPSIVMGDFNAQSDDPELAVLIGADSDLQDSWGVAGDGGAGLTIPANPNETPDRRIDFILATRDFTMNRVWVVIDEMSVLASDHYPVVADLDFA